jgi:hypothetical protein
MRSNLRGLLDCKVLLARKFQMDDVTVLDDLATALSSQKLLAVRG